MSTAISRRDRSNVDLDQLEEPGSVVARPAIDRQGAAATFFRGAMLLHLVVSVLSFGFWLPVFLLWVLGFGQWYSRRRAEELDYRLLPGRLLVKDGVFTKVRKTIPLDKVTDLGMQQGIIDRWLGLWTLRVQTASSGGAVAEAIAYGVKDPKEFRRAVLEQREQWLESGDPQAAPALNAAPRSSLESPEVSDKLSRIETLLAKIAENTTDR